MLSANPSTSPCSKPTGRACASQLESPGSGANGKPRARLLELIHSMLVEEGDCLMWQGPMGSGQRNKSQPVVRQYSAEKRYGERLAVRRLLWEAEHGPIPPGQIIYCTCGAHRCCGHLAIGKRGAAHTCRAKLGLAVKTPAARAGAARGARKGANAKYSMEQARVVRELAAEGIPIPLICWAADVSESAASDMRSGRSWREQLGPASVFDWRPR